MPMLLSCMVILILILAFQHKPPFIHRFDRTKCAGLAPIMDQLSEKLYDEGKENILVISNVFVMPGDRCIGLESKDPNIFVYRKKT